jgi:cytochrome P450
MTVTRAIAELPGPRGLPLLGVTHKLLPVSRTHLAFEEWGRRYGPIFRTKVGTRLVVGIGDADAINEILRDRPQGFRRWSEQEQVILEMGHGPPSVFVAEGEQWKRQRRLVITALNTNHLHRYFDVVHTSTERLHRRLLKAARDGRELSIADELTSYTVDVVSALAFGHDLNTLERGDNELQGHIQRVLSMTARRLVAPFPYWRHVKLPADRALDRSMRAIYQAVEGFLAAARERLTERPELYDEPKNLLEGMLAAQREDGSFTDQEIANNVLTLLIAGEDTTSHTLGWTMWLLATRPDIQERLAAEAVEVLGGDAFPVEYEATQQLSYTEAVLQESMRLKSVTPVIGVEPLENKIICGTKIPAGTRLLLLLRQACRTAAGRSEDFYPERWLKDSDETRAPRSLTFGAGPRFCPGRNLAFLEAKSALAMIARNFELELDDSGGPVRESFGFAMTPRGLRVRLHERPAKHLVSA